jgi:hypothetical protein
VPKERYSMSTTKFLDEAVKAVIAAVREGDPTAPFPRNNDEAWDEIRHRVKEALGPPIDDAYAAGCAQGRKLSV